MMLGSESVSVLMRALDTLNHQMSPAQHALLTPDERKSAMHQLTVVVEAAAKLADVAHVEALTARSVASGPASPDSGALTKSIVVAETETLRTEGAETGSEVEKVEKVLGSSVVPGAEVPAVAGTVMEQEEEGENQVRRAQQHMEEIDAEKGVRGGEPTGDIEGAKKDMCRLMVEKEMMEAEIEGLEADEQSAGKSLEVSMQEKGRLQVELERVGIEKARTEPVTIWLRVELETLRIQKEDVMRRGYKSGVKLAKLEVSSAERMFKKSHEETEKVEAEEERVVEDFQRSMQETERLHVVLARVRNQKAILEAGMERLRKEVDRLRYVTEIEREG